MKKPEQKPEGDLWIVTINDGFCTYEYKFLSRNEDICIAEVAERVQCDLLAKLVERTAK